MLRYMVCRSTPSLRAKENLAFRGPVRSVIAYARSRGQALSVVSVSSESSELSSPISWSAIVVSHANQTK